MNLMVTALHCAAITGQPSCVESLIRAGADTRLRDGVSECPAEIMAGREGGSEGRYPAPPSTHNMHEWT